MELLEKIAPEKVAKAQKTLMGDTSSQWIDPRTNETYESSAYSRILGWYAFDMELPGKSKRTVSISYLQTPTLDEEKELIHYEYLLQPAANWHSFANLDLKVFLLRE